MTDIEEPKIICIDDITEKIPLYFDIFGKKYKCKICPFKTCSIRNIFEHNYKHNNIKPYRCMYCCYQTRWSSMIRKHKCKLKTLNNYNT